MRDGTLAVGGTQKFDGSQSFSMGVWLRPTSSTATGTLLARPGAFELTLQNGVPNIAFGGANAFAAPGH